MKISSLKSFNSLLTFINFIAICYYNRYN